MLPEMRLPAWSREPILRGSVRRFCGRIRGQNCLCRRNKTDISIADTAAEQKAIGIAIAKGILNTLGIAYKSVESSTSDVLYKIQVGAFGNKANAEAYLEKVKAAGFKDAYIVTVKK